MDYFTKNKMLFWWVVILVVINVMTLSSLWFRRPPVKPGSGMNGNKIMEERLGLSKDQAEQFKRIRKEHFMRTRPLQDDKHKIRMDLLDEIFFAEPDESKIQKLTAEIGNKQAEFEKNLFGHFLELKKACDQQQAEELKFMLIDLIERTRPRGHRHHFPGDKEGFRPGRMRPPGR